MRGIVEPDTECGLTFGFRLVNGMAFWWLAPVRDPRREVFQLPVISEPGERVGEKVRVFLVQQEVVCCVKRHVPLISDNLETWMFRTYR